MHGRDDLSAFANGGADAFHRSRTDIAHGEYAATACLQKWRTRSNIWAGEHEPLGIEPHEAGQPLAARHRAYEEEEVADRPPDCLV
jgi:hypothetical protein